MTHDLVAPCDEPAPPLGLLVRDPDLRQETAGLQLRQNAGVDLVGLNPCMRDRLHLHRIGDDHPADMGRQHPDHRHRVARRLDDHLVLIAKTAAEAF